MTHLINQSETVLVDEFVNIFQFFTKETKYVISDTVIVQNTEDRTEVVTSVIDCRPTPFKSQYKLVTLKEKQNA